VRSRCSATWTRVRIFEWGFDSALIEVAGHADDWGREEKSEIDLCDLVVAAQLYLAERAGLSSKFPALAETPVGRKLGADENDLLAILAQRAAREIAVTRDLLAARLSPQPVSALPQNGHLRSQW
jgi:hypothetical protein